eukprot:CAMPEP_0179903182 /NCGR_PEP_ID=MMETSP0982-20121206/41075_1 /TAXON_ID=483367 /ORGANISM="non described non described, Strain CCMP 2436" /LENGTH=106 /DNA_ID=CAMNT_0021802607 /DNA_START=12 /DNA_END=328 /DNA_ORIENTATION=+
MERAKGTERAEGSVPALIGALVEAAMGKAPADARARARLRARAFELLLCYDCSGCYERGHTNTLGCLRSRAYIAELCARAPESGSTSIPPGVAMILALAGSAPSAP